MDQLRELQKYLDVPVELKKLLKALSFSADQLEHEELRQPKLYLMASKYKTQLMQERYRAQRKYDLLTAEKKLKLRRVNHGKKRSDGDRLTESGISDAVHLDEDVRKARIRLDRAYVLEEFGKQLVEAYRQRKDMLKELTAIRNGEIANEIRMVRQGIVKKDMNRMRKAARRRADELGELDEDSED